jgi:hypothetical protein
MSVEILISKQNPDGGWPYIRGKSWTEPTVYATMAALAAGENDAAGRALRWLVSARRSDGGWAPQPCVDQSTWVTGLVALLPAELVGNAAHSAAIHWLIGTVGRESTMEHRLRQWLLGNPIPSDQELGGWPWVPGTSSWVGPTSLAILALDKEQRHKPSGGIGDRVADGRKFLLGRMCQNGGWNHGSVRALGYESESYSETTGIALMALRGVESPRVRLSLGVARRFLDGCRSADALNWLRLGLLAHGELPEGFCPPADITCRSVIDLSLDLVLAKTGAVERFFWEQA